MSWQGKCLKTKRGFLTRIYKTVSLMKAHQNTAPSDVARYQQTISSKWTDLRSTVRWPLAEKDQKRAAIFENSRRTRNATPTLGAADPIGGRDRAELPSGLRVRRWDGWRAGSVRTRWFQSSAVWKRVTRPATCISRRQRVCPPKSGRIAARCGPCREVRPGLPLSSARNVGTSHRAAAACAQPCSASTMVWCPISA